MGLLSNLWHALKSATTTAPDDKVDLTIEDLLNLIQQKVLLFGQTNNTISYIIGSLARWLSHETF